MDDPEPGPREGLFGERAAARRFRRVAERVVDALLESAPETATELGDHRFDDRLDDLSDRRRRGTAATCSRDALQALDGVDDAGLDPRRPGRPGDPAHRGRPRPVDGWTELRDARARPAASTCPGDALYPLLVRDVGEPAARVARAHRPARRASRTACDVARDHAARHAAGARRDGDRPGPRRRRRCSAPTVDALRRAGPRRLRLARSDARPRARGGRGAGGPRRAGSRRGCPMSDGDPRLGEQRFAAKLWYALDTETAPGRPAHPRRERPAGGRGGDRRAGVRGSPARRRGARPGARGAGPARRRGPGRRTRRSCRCASRPSAGTTDRVRELDLVSVPRRPGADHRHAAGAARGRGRLLRPARAAGAAGARRPARCRRCSPSRRPRRAGAPERVASFYREYNGHMLRNLTVHEAMPGPRAAARPRRPVPRRRPGCGRRAGAGRSSRAGPCTPRSCWPPRGSGWARRGRRRAADAAAEDAAAHDDQRDPRRPGARPRHDRGRGAWR